MEGFAGFYVLLLIPGFIWVQVFEHHLLREKKEQFVKTMEVVLWSGMFWAGALILPCEPSETLRKSLVYGVRTGKILASLMVHPREMINVFVAVTLVALVMANIWALTRKSLWLNALLKGLTGRDWYPSVRFRFYRENIDSGITFVANGNRYAGILFSAPDTVDDKYIMLKSVWYVPDDKEGEPFQQMNVDSILFNVDDVNELVATSLGVEKTNPWSTIIKRRDWLGGALRRAIRIRRRVVCLRNYLRTGWKKLAWRRRKLMRGFWRKICGL